MKRTNNPKLPMIVGSVLAASMMLGEQPAHAQPAPKPQSAAGTAGAASAGPESDAWTKKARELYNDGTKAYKQSKWAEAHALFSAAWSLKKHWQIAANLSDCELKLGKFQEAAIHAQYYAQEAPAEKKAAAEAFLKQAQANVGTMKVKVNRTDADVLVDGEKVGVSPINDAIFVLPGEHVFSARMAGLVAEEQRMNVAAGSSHDVELELKEPPRKVEVKPGEPVAVEPAAVPKRSLVPAYALGGGALLGFGLGLGFYLAGTGQVNDASALALEIAQAGGSCKAGAGRHAKCDELDAIKSKGVVFDGLSLTSTIVGGLCVGGAVLYLAWPYLRPRKSESVSTKAESAILIPLVGAREAGMSLVGSF